ncbi:hypothetical protein BH10BAC5_BH10BAC5_00450 [soil metagenome]
MKKIFSILFLACLILSFTFLIKNKYFTTNITQQINFKPASIGDDDDPNARAEREFKMLRDPVTNKIPDGIREKEIQFTKGLPKNTGTKALTWSERGPNNVGGRTRALLGDIADTSIIIAGGVSGGIWRSTNSGANWTQRTTLAQLHNATCITQDVRAGNTNKWYMGTGERDGNTAGQFGAPNNFTGDGIFKSLDNGVTWNLLPATSGSSPINFNSNWQYVWGVAADRSNLAEDEIYSANIGSLYRTSNGGTNWTLVLGDNPGQSTFTDVKCSSTGVVYATGSFTAGGTMNGVYRSADGITWANITPVNFPATYGRIVTAIAPSNETVVYFAVHEVPPGEPNSVNKHQLWKYTYLSGDGSGAGGTWTALGGNLPQAGQGNLGTFNEPFDTQSGYDFTIQIGPSDANLIILGGVNLYRSTDGFSTTTNTKRIGGYEPTVENGTYPGSHPDIHTGYFQPGSNVTYFSGNDGGVTRTNDVTANDAANTPVTWNSLSPSYNVTQFYAVSMDPETGSPWIAGGFQDNGSYATNSATLTSPWAAINSGDGGYCSIAPLVDDRVYSTSQNGALDRAQRDGNGNADMKPAGALHQSFINPHILDNSNSSFLYYAGGTSATTTGIWRNNDAKNGTTVTGWSYLAGTDVGSASAQVSTISVSKANNSNVVYYGTEEGHIRRIDNASTTANVSTNLNTGAMPTGAFVSCLAIDPTNSSNVIAVFSNYNVNRLWYTTDAGASWVNIDGNLSGATGPSVRYATIFYKSSVLHVFLATSVGVFYTTNINGGATVWTQEAVSTIGNVVTVMFDYRAADNTLVAATHGRGSFSAVVAVPLPVELLAFNSSVSGSNVQLNWSTGSESNNLGFDIERKTDNSSWLKTGFVKGKGNSNTQSDYSFTDNNLQTGKYNYRLKQIDYNGNIQYYSLMNEVTIGIPGKFALYQNFPNPFNPSTNIKFDIPSSGTISLMVYSLTGKLVETLEEGFRQAGNYSVIYDASKLSSGIYFYKLITSDGFVETRKMLFVK